MGANPTLIWVGVGLALVALLGPEEAEARVLRRPRTPEEREEAHAAALGRLLIQGGALYSYGGGGPSAPWPEGSPGLGGGTGWDCSGLALGVLAARGFYPWGGARLRAAQIADLGTPVAWGTQQPFDIATYPGHVAMVLTYSGAHGDSSVLSAAGTQRTNGDDPSRRVRIHDSMRYRKDWNGISRIRAQEGVGSHQLAVVDALRRVLLAEPRRLLDTGSPERLAFQRIYGGSVPPSVVV